MICYDCLQDLPESSFSCGRKRCKKCQYIYQKNRNKIFIELKKLSSEFKLLTNIEKRQKLVELYSQNYSIHDLKIIFETNRKIIIDTLIEENIYKSYCYKCKQFKHFTEFAKSKNGMNSDGLQSMCKSCRKQNDSTKSVKEYHKKYAIDNAERLQKYRHEYNKLNKNHRSNYNKNWAKNKYNSDIKYKINVTFGHNIWTSLKSMKCNKSWKNLVGYTLTELMEHLESKFQPGMTWDNYGEWHIDHIIPKSSFNITSIDCDDFKKCWCLENLQPLWAKDNIKKSNKIGPEWGNDKLVVNKDIV